MFASAGATYGAGEHPRLVGRLVWLSTMDRIVHNTIWVATGGHNMREHTASQVQRIKVRAVGSPWPPTARQPAPKANIDGPRRQYSLAPKPAMLTMPAAAYYR